MALPNVAQGDPHVNAHNDERAAINALESQIADLLSAQASATIPAFSVAGVLTAKTFGNRIYVLEDVVIDRLFASVDVAPTGSDVVLDLLIDGTTSAFGGTKPTITAGTHTVDVDTNISVTAGTYLKLQTVSVGSTQSGSDLTVQMEVV